MEMSVLVANPNVGIADSLPAFAREAERELSALFHSVRDSYGENAASRVADGWIDILGACLANCGGKLPKVRDITVRSITCFLVPYFAIKSQPGGTALDVERTTGGC